MRLSVRPRSIPPAVVLGCVVLAALAAATAGCGGEHDATEKQLSELRAEIARLRATQASLGERVDAIDIERGAFAKGAAAAPPPGPGAIAAAPTAPVTAAPHAGAAGDGAATRPRTTPEDRDRPELDVVRLSPSEGDGDADNDPSRPVVRATGDGKSAPAAPTPTLNNRSLGARSVKRGVTAATPKKSDSDARRPAEAKP
jgi:hypothetical protein